MQRKLPSVENQQPTVAPCSLEVGDPQQVVNAWQKAVDGQLSREYSSVAIEHLETQPLAKQFVPKLCRAFMGIATLLKSPRPSGPENLW